MEIIFICTHDPFARGAIKYSFRTVCNELPDLDINDNAQKIVYNANGYNLIEDERLKAFLKFISTNKPTDDFTKSLENEVETVKLNEIFRSDYMVRSTRETDLLDEGEEIGFSKGHAAGIIEGAHQNAIDNAIAFLKDGDSVEKVSRCINLPLEVVQKLAEEIKAGLR